MKKTTVVEFLPFEYTILKEEEEPETPIESISALAVGSSDTHPQTQLEPDVAGATTAAATATSEAPAGATLDQYKLAQDWLAKVSGSGAPAPAPSTAQSVIVDAAAAAVGVEGEVQWVEPVQSEAAEEVSTGAEAPDEDSFHQHADHIDGTDAPLENSVEASAVVDVVSLEESPVEDSAIKASVEIPAQAEETATEEEGEAVVENIVPAAVVDVSATEELSRADASTTTEASAVGQSSAADLTDTSAGKEQGTVQMADDAEEEVITHEDADPQQQRQLETEDFLDLDSYLRDDFLVDVRDMYPNFDVVSLLMRLQAEMGHFRVSKRILIQNIEAVIQRDAGRSRDN